MIVTRLVWCHLLAATSVVLAADFSPRFDDLRRTATPTQLYQLLYALPKGGDLHNHAGGSNRSEWMWETLTDPALNGGDRFFTRARFGAAPDAIAASARFHTIRQHTYNLLNETVRREYVPLSELTPEERLAWANAFRLDAADEGRMEFFNAHWPRLGDINRNPHVRIELLVRNIKAFSAEGLRYLEAMFDVDGCSTNDGRSLAREETLVLLEERLAQPDVRNTGMVVRFLATVLRFAPHAEGNLAADYAWVSAHRDRWVGLNMAGIEENGHGYPLRFLETYRSLRAKHPTLPLSIHAGEMDGPNTHVRDTLLLGATRIGHGVNILQDPETLLLLQQSQRTLIEINLISNQLLEYTPDLSRHPFPELLRTGVPVCLNTDDRGMWDSNLTDEYYTAVTAFNLSWQEIVALGRNSLAHAFVEAPVKAKLLADYDAAIEAFEHEYGAGTVQDALARLASVRAETYGYAKRVWGFEFTRAE
jgi:adenosine deaminase CECR1